MTGLGQRKAILQQMESLGADRVRLEFRMPSRGLFGYRNLSLIHIFDGQAGLAGRVRSSLFISSCSLGSSTVRSPMKQMRTFRFS